MSGYIGPAPVPQATQTREAFTATSGQTTFNTGGYTVGYIDVFLNGVKLAAADYTATNGSDVVLATGAATGDILETVAYTAFTVADQDFTGTTTAEDLTVTGAFTSQGIDDNATSTAMTLDSSGNLLVGTTDSNPVSSNVNSGVQFGDGRIRASRVDRTVLELNRKTSDGAIAEFRKDGTTMGNIGTAGGDLWIGSSAASHAAVRFANGTMFPVSNTGGSSNGLVDIGDSLARFKDLYLSGGVYLGGTGSANKLDDVETGSWTPYLAGATGITYTTQTGSYVKVGDLVHLQWRLGFSGTMGGSNIRIAGRPFYQYIHDTASNVGILGERSALNIGANDVFFPALYQTADAIYIYNTSFGALNYTSVWKAGTISGTLTYRAN